MASWKRQLRHPCRKPADVCRHHWGMKWGGGKGERHTQKRKDHRGMFCSFHVMNHHRQDSTIHKTGTLQRYGNAFSFLEWTDPSAVHELRIQIRNLQQQEGDTDSNRLFSSGTHFYYWLWVIVLHCHLLQRKPSKRHPIWITDRKKRRFSVITEWLWAVECP